MFPPICLGREALQVSVPSIWSVISTKSVYEATETSGGPPETDGLAPDNLPGRYPLYAFKQRSTGGNGTIDSEPIRSIRPNGEQTQITSNTNSIHRVFGFSNKLPHPKTLPTFGEEQEDTAGSSQASPPTNSDSQRAGHVHWEGYSNLQGSVASPVTLQCPSEGTQLNNSWERLPGTIRQIQNSSFDERRDEERSSVVDNIRLVECRHTDMFHQHSSSGVGIRRFPEGMGSTVHGNQHRGLLVDYGSTVPYQLPRVISCLPSPQDLCKRSEGLDLVEDGQCISSDIHQPKRGYTLNATVRSSPADMGMVYPERYNLTSRTPAWQSQHSGRHGIPDGQGQMRLDDQSNSVSTNTTFTRSIRDRLICIPSNQATTPLLQLEARPGSGGSGCLLTELGTSEGFCQPSMVPNTTVSEPDKTTRSSSSVDNTPLALSVLVPSSPRDAAGLSSSTSISSRPDIESIQSIHNATGNSNTGRMAYLRQSFTSRGISTQASDLLLSSWRDKTNTSYNSLFAKWADWCEQRSRDPTVGPVEDVVNFLAELFAKGYQYRSLNAYRSAISSIHQKVDGQDIGQHPLVCRLLKGSYNQNPPTPRYSHFWDVGVVLRFFGQLGTNASLPLKWISIKTAMLMALTRPSRSADLSKLDIRFRTYTAKGVIFQPTHLSKQSRSSKPIKEFFFPLYTTDENICPVRALQAYEGRTASFRENNNKSTLFLSWIGKHDPVSSSTITRWLRICLQEAGINTDTFKAHSVRGAASSSAAWSGVTTLDILNAADWSSETTYQQFYHRDVQDRSTFGSAVLSSASTSNLHVDMETEPSEM